MITVNDLKLAGDDLALTFFASAMNVADDILVFGYKHIGECQAIIIEYDCDGFYEIRFYADETFTISKLDDYVFGAKRTCELCCEQPFDITKTIYEQVIDVIKQHQ